MMYQQRMINIVDTQFCFIFADRQMWCFKHSIFPLTCAVWPLTCVAFLCLLGKISNSAGVWSLLPLQRWLNSFLFLEGGLSDCILRMTQREIFPWCWMRYAGPHLNLWQEIELKWGNWKAAFPCPLSSFNRRERTSLDCCVRCRHWGPTLQLLHAIGGAISFFLSHALTRFVRSPNTICPTGLSMSLPTHPVTVSFHLLWGASLPEVLLQHGLPQGKDPWRIICFSWASLDNFSRFYRVNVATPRPLVVVLWPEISDSMH